MRVVHFHLCLLGGESKLELTLTILLCEFYSRDVPLLMMFITYGYLTCFTSL